MFIFLLLSQFFFLPLLGNLKTLETFLRCFAFVLPPQCGLPFGRPFSFSLRSLHFFFRGRNQTKILIRCLSKPVCVICSISFCDGRL